MLRLSESETGAECRVERVDLPDDEARWLASVGISTGDRITVLRRALFGGPLHVRTQSGGEFALGRELAAQVFVEQKS